ncbi:MAG: nitroreductase family protein [Gammaproteobacteria bacterium]
MSGFDIPMIDHLLSTTRAVRRRLDFDRPVERDVVLDCIRVSQQAPTAHNIQNWRWIVIDDPGIKAGLAADFAKALPTIERMSTKAATDQDRRFWESVKFLTANLARVPVLVIPCVAGFKAEYDLGGGAVVYGSIFPAIWSFQLALRARGLGSCLTTQHLMNKKNSDRLLGIPEDVMQIALLPVAYTRGTDFKPAQRPGPESITTFNGWHLDG